MSQPPTAAQEKPKAEEHKLEHEEEHPKSNKKHKSEEVHERKKYEEYDQEDERDDEGMADDLAGDACHDMQIGDACCALICPCITYGQILDSLDPNIMIKKKQQEMERCHVSTGCLLWTGLVGLTVGGVQSLISIPGVCGWMPTIFLGDLLDARELFLACGYMLPQWCCHLPLRSSIVGKGKKGENVCCSCLISSFCCCCSLSSLKSLGQENRVKYREDDVCMGKCCPCCGALDSNYETTRSQYDDNDSTVNEEEEEEEYEAQNNSAKPTKSNFLNYNNLLSSNQGSSDGIMMTRHVNSMQHFYL